MSRTREKNVKKNSDSYDDNDSNSHIENSEDSRRKKEKRKRHRSRRKSRHNDDDDDGSSIDSRDSDHYERQRRRKKSRKSHYSSSSSDDGDNEEENYRRKKKYHDRHSRKHKKKRKKKKHRKSKYEYDSSSSSSSSRRRSRKKRSHSKKHKRKEEKKEKSIDTLSRNYEFANALRSLLTYHPDMATELPYIFIQLAQGTSLDLTQMSNAHASESLTNVFQSLSSFGLALDGNSWKWTECSNGSNQSQDLILIKISKILLDQIGVTQQAINEYENPTVLQNNNRDIPQENIGMDGRMDNTPSLVSSSDNEIENLTLLLLQKFDNATTNDDKNATKTQQSQLVQGIVEMCQMIQQDEIISIDDIPNEELKVSLDKLFSIVGCVKEEMEQDDDDDEGGFGFVVPENETKDSVLKNMEHVIQACQRYQNHSKPSQNETKKRVIGPSLPSSAGSYTKIINNDNEIVSSDDDLGPSPYLPGITKMVKRRKAGQSINPSQQDSGKGGKREEWMMVPGEHNFLKDVMNSDGALKSRTFRNEKSSSTAQPVPLDPKVQEEINAVKQAYNEARGPSLLETHRQQKKEKAASSVKNQKEDWKWNREKDLDEGRRVDKNALKMVLGGAADGLNDKFQGSFSRSFM